jgi:hypothetical protein
MNYLLYNNIRNIVKDDLKNINSSLVGGAFSNLLLQKDTKKFEEKVIGLLTNIKDYKGYENLKTKLNIYKGLLEDLDTKLGDENIPDSGYLNIAQQIKELLDPVDPTTGIRIISNLFETSNNFTQFIDIYKQFLDENTWNEDRLALDIDVNDIDAPDRFNIYIKTQDSIDKFNAKLKILFAPILNDLNKPLGENIDENIQKVEEITKLSKNFSSYINEKKKNIDDILASNYNIADCAIEDNTSGKIKAEDYLIDLQNVGNNSSLDLGSVFNLENDINNIIEFINVRDEMNSIGNIDIFDKTRNLIDILNIDDVVHLKGGDFKSKYYITNSSKKMLTLSKKLEKLFEILDTTLDDAKYLKELQLRYNFYIAYLFLIIRNSASKLNPTDNVKIYEYLPIDKIDLYLDLLKKINNDFKNIDSSKKGLKYFNTYHYLTINKLINLLEFLKRNILPTQLVKVLECRKNVNSDLILFNHFRLILIKFCNTSEGSQYLQNGIIIDDL